MKRFRRLLPSALLALSLLASVACRAEVFNLSIIPDTQLEVMADSDTRLANRMQWLADQKGTLFDQLLKPYANVRLVFSGHTGSHGYHSDTGASGNTIYEFLQCFHDKSANPVRLLEIDTEKGTIKSDVYCPATNQHKPEAAFTVNDVQWIPPH